MIKIPSQVIIVCIVFPLCLFCWLLSENIRTAYGQGILIMSGGVSSAGKKPSIPLMYYQSKKIHPLIYREMERKERNYLVLQMHCFHLNTPIETEIIYTLNKGFCPVDSEI